MDYEEAIVKTAEMLGLPQEKVLAEVNKIILEKNLPDWRVAVALYKSKSGRLSNPPVEMEALLFYKGPEETNTEGTKRWMQTIWMETKAEPKLWFSLLFGEQIDKWSDLDVGQVYHGNARLNKAGGSFTWEDRAKIAEGVLLTAEDVSKLMLTETNVKNVNGYKEGADKERPPNKVIVGLVGKLIGKEKKSFEFVGLHIDSPVIPIWPKEWTKQLGEVKEGGVVLVVGRPNKYQDNINFSPDIIYPLL